MRAFCFSYTIYPFLLRLNAVTDTTICDWSWCYCIDHYLFSSYSVIVLVRVVLKRTVLGTDVSTTWAEAVRSHLWCLDDFTLFWRWLPLRLSKRQSPTTVLFRTTFTRTITLYELLILLGSNHLLYKSLSR